MKTPALLSLLVTLALPLAGLAADRPVQARVYVDAERGADANTGATPEQAFRSLVRARDEVRKQKAKMTGDIVVSLRGKFILSEPLALTEADSGEGGFRVIWEGAAGERPLISGEKAIGPWKLFDKEKNIYSTVLDAPVNTRSLFVNGNRAVRARSSGGLKDAKKIAEGYTTTDLDVLKWSNVSDAEFVYRQIWTNPRVPIESVQETDGLATFVMKQAGWDNARNKGMTSVSTPWYTENVYELLDEPGEWYMDRSGKISGTPNTVFYMPHRWEDMTKAVTLLPVQENLITIIGSSLDKPVKDITFRGIDFSYTTWTRPNTEFGVSDAQNNVMREKKTEGGEFIASASALRFHRALGMAIERCRFVKLGGIGVTMLAGSQNNTIQGNVFDDVAGTGIQFGDYLEFENPASENFYFPADERLQIAKNRILNNYLNRCGSEYRSATAIAMSFPRECEVSNNEITNMPYSGIHFGWAWDRAKFTVMHSNRINNNFIRNTMLELADGAAFYTLGASLEEAKRSTLEGNYAQQTRWGQGYYFDESSSFYTMDTNVSVDIGDFNIKVNGKGNNNITVKNLYSNKDRNTVTKGSWNIDIAPAIIINEETRPKVDALRAAAGLQAAYQDIRPSRIDQFIHEAEEADLSGGANATSGLGTGVYGYSGMGFVTGLEKREGSTVSFPVEVSKGGNYEVRAYYCTPTAQGDSLDLQVNGESVGGFPVDQTGDKFTWEAIVAPVVLKAGKNTVALVASRTLPSTFLDRIEVTPVP